MYSPSQPAGIQSGTTIVFIESDVAGYAQLVDSLAPGSEVHVLDAGLDGLAEIARILGGRSGVETVHIVSHGADGLLQLGTTRLEAANLAGHMDALGQIKSALAPGADLLLYGCDVAAGPKGAALLEGLHQATGADIAASNDATGAAALGGDWLLESTVGAVQSASISAPSYTGLLPVPQDVTFDQNVNQLYQGQAQYGSFTFITPGYPTSSMWSTDAWTLPVGSGNVFELNVDEAPVSSLYVQPASVNDNFKLVSMAIASLGTPGAPVTTSFRIYGYEGGYNGIVVASGSFSILASSTGSVTYTLANGSSSAGTLTFGPAWQNVDSFMFQANGGNGIHIAIDDINVEPPAPIQSATYDAATGTLAVTAYNLAAGATVASNALTLYGEGGFYTLTSGNVTAVANGFSVTLSDADKMAVNGLLNKNGVAAAGGATFNLVADVGWTAGASAGSGAITVSNVTAPAITSAVYLADSDQLVVTGTNLVHKAGASNDITVSKLTITGEGGTTYTLSSSDVEAASATGFTVNLSAADRDAIELILNKNGGTSTGGTAYNLAAADDWNTVITGASIADAASPLSVQNVAVPVIDSATYNAATGALTVTGSGFTKLAGAANDIIGSCFTITGQHGLSYTYAGTPSVEVTSGTSFTIMLDKALLIGVIDNNGTTSTGGDVYKLTAADGWAAGCAVPHAEDTLNVITVTGVARPSVTSITMGTAVLEAGGSTTVTVTLSAPVGAFPDMYITASNASLTSPMTSDGGTTWTATLTPATGTTAATNVVHVDASGLVSVWGYKGMGSLDSSNYVVDTQIPTATIAIADTVLKAGETTDVTITFSEAVTGLTNADLTIENGALSPLSTSDGGVTWTATFTPSANVADAANVITLANAGLQDLNGNAGAGTTVSANYEVSTVRPAVVSLTLSDLSFTAGETARLDFQFSEAVTGLTLDDLRADGGALSDLATSDGGVSWSATYTPFADTERPANRITVYSTGVTNAAGNAGLNQLQTPSFPVDTRRPTATIALDDSALAVGETAHVTITFSEPVIGFSNADLTVQNATISALATSDNITYTATLTPSVGVTAATNVITLANGGVTDGAGNANMGAVSANYAIDSEVPTATITMGATNLMAGQTTTVTIAFSEAVTGFTSADLTVQSGTLGTLETSDGGRTWSATFTPNTGVSAPNNNITLDNTGIADLAGNVGVGTTVFPNYGVYTVRPTASIAVANTALKAGDTSLVTITFSEPVTGLAANDFTVANGALSGLSSSDGITWTATLTPTAGATAGTNAIHLDTTGVANSLGNTGSGTVSSNNYTVDTARPAATITMSDSALKAGETSLVTITFAEAVTGLTIGALGAPNGVLSGLTTADNITYTATYTPAANKTAATNAITFDNSLVLDTAGNSGTGTSSSANFTIDTAVPTAAITMVDTNLKAGEASLVTIAFSEAVTGLGMEDLSFGNGSLADLASSDGGRTWTAIFTPAANTSAATNLITLDVGGVKDLAGNMGAGTASTPNYTVQTVRPTATVAVDQAPLKTGDTATVTITFSEAVSGFTTADLTVPNASLKNLKSTDGGITWTATLTPAGGVNDDTNTVSLDLAGVMNAAGNPGAGTAVSNNYVVSTWTPGSGTSSSITVDGVPGTVSTGTDWHTGFAVEVLSIPVVSPGRVDDPATPNAGLADIALGVTNPNGAAIALTVSLPVGAGLTASGPGTALTGERTLAYLIPQIADTAGNVTAQDEMTGYGHSFLAGLAPDTGIETRTLVLAGGDSAGALPAVHIAGAASQPGAAVALVIDTTALPQNSVILLDNVEFAAVVGSATLRGGDGRQFVTADSASQNIYLGADDDELHGGGGDDVVGSAGGNDLIDGGSGNDFVFGGIGNDTVMGGTGNDIVLGGRSDAGQWQFFIDAAGKVSARHETAIVAPGSWESVSAAELDASAAGLRFLHADSGRLQELALLYDAAFGRAADVQGLEFWASHGGDAYSTMKFFMQQSEYGASKYAGLDNEAFVRALYANVLGRDPDSAGLAFWTSKLQDGSQLRSDILAGFALSDEHQARVTKDGAILLAGATVGAQAQWFAGSGDDRLDGGAGSDLLVGGDGTDTVVYAGTKSQYHVLLSRDGTVHIDDTSNGDTDTVYGIERAEFAGASVDLRFTQADTGALQSLGLLYHALFGRAGDADGVNWWATHGGNPLQLAQAFLLSGESQARYEGTDDSAFAAALFQNTGLQSGQAGGLGYWAEYAHSHSRAETVAAWIANTDVIGTQFGTAGLWLV